MSTLTQFFSTGGGVGSPVPDTMKVVEFLLVGGGGGGAGGGGTDGAGGGGAGGMVEGKEFLVNNGQTFAITIGAGGAGSPYYTSGTTGSSSSFGNIYAGGGGGGQTASYTFQPIGTMNGSVGGSGGGSAINSQSPSTLGTSGTGGVSSGGINAVTNVFDKITVIRTFASPGGNTVWGLSPTGYNAGNGGGASGSSLGRSNSITGSPVTYSAGGAGKAAGTAGTANTGNGGDAAPTTSGAGGSGVCIVRWPTAYPDATSVTGNTPTPAQPGYYVYRWNGSGSITF